MSSSLKSNSKWLALTFILGVAAPRVAERLISGPSTSAGDRDANLMLQGAIDQAGEDSRYELYAATDALDDPDASRMNGKQVSDCLALATTYAIKQGMLKPGESFTDSRSSKYGTYVIMQAAQTANRGHSKTPWNTTFVHSVVEQVMSDRWINLHGNGVRPPTLAVAEAERNAARDLSWSIQIKTVLVTPLP